MNLLSQLRKSNLIAPAEKALREAKNQDELEDRWFDYADGFADESPERRYLIRVYDDRLRQLRAEHMARLLRV